MKIKLFILLLSFTGTLFGQQGQSAIDSLSKCLLMAQNDSARASILRSTATVFISQGNYPMGVELLLKSKALFESIHNSYGIFRCVNQLSVCYCYLGQFEDALAYLKTAQLGLEDGLIYDNLALIFYHQNKINESLLYYKKALDFYKNKNDNRFIARLLNNVGSMYEIQKNDSAILFYLESLKVSEETNNKRDILSAYASLGDLSFRQGEIYKSFEYETKSLKLATEIKDLISIKETHLMLSDIYFKLGDYKNSILSYKSHIAIKDSLAGESTLKQIGRIEERFKNEKERALIMMEQSKKDILKAEELKHQRTQRNLFIGGFVIVLIFSVFLFRSFKKTQHQKNIISEQRKEVMDNIRYAKRIQDAVTTSPSLIKELLPNSFILNKARDTVSGDFLFAEAYQNEIILAVADCTNHSVSGAMMSILCHNLLNDAVINGNHAPSDILNYVNIAISKKFHQTEKDDTKGELDIVKDGMDVVVIKLDLVNMKYQYSGAYNPLIIIRDNKLSEIKADKLQLGQTNLKYKNNEGELKIGDMLFMSSDGYQDQFSSSGKKFMKKKFKELLLSISHKPINEQKMVLEKTLDEWQNGCPQTDDILVMGITI